MNNTEQRAARASVKQDAVVARLRQAIVRGEYAAGAQIPPQTVLCRQYGVSSVTAQLALARLTREGFLVSRPRRGCFVVDQPPHLNDYALVFPFDPTGPFAERTWSHYYVALNHEAVRLQRETGKRMLTFHGLDQHTDTPDRQRLIECLAAQCVAGVIFANAPFLLANTPILDLPGMPRVAIESKQVYPHVPIVTHDSQQWVIKALDYLSALGRKRVAMIRLDREADATAWVQQRLAERGMVSRSRWTQYVALNSPRGATHAAELLMHDRERPNALIVEDDNFVEPVVAGLVAAGVRVPEDIAVVGHANFPWPPATALPVRLLGYDVGAMLRLCVESIDRQRAGEEVPGVTSLPALWEDEFRSDVDRISRPRALQPVPQHIRQEIMA